MSEQNQKKKMAEYQKQLADERTKIFLWTIAVVFCPVAMLIILVFGALMIFG